MSREGRKLTRRQVLAAGTVIAGAGVLIGDRLLSGDAATPTLGDHAHIFHAAFPEDRSDDWGEGWVPLHYGGRIAAEGGIATFDVPVGLRGTAPHQPMPVQLLDRECQECEQLATLAVSDATLRPGVMVGGRGPFAFHAVTAEGARLVVARYGRESREILAQAPLPKVSAGTSIHARVVYAGGRIRGRAWPEGATEPGWQVDVRADLDGGTPGVVAVHPESLEPCRLTVSRYELGADHPFAPTSPAALMALSGIPTTGRSGALQAIARVWSAYPADVTFEWSTDPGFASAASAPEIAVRRGPLTAAHVLALPAGHSLWWRAQLRSVTSGATVVTDAHEIAPHPSDAPLVMLAASCVHLTGPPPNAGFARLLEAASSRPRCLVFQGDAGYANNRVDACYARAPDFFADRFARFLADPAFAALRGRVPTGFTIDDHDYGPENNADRLSVDRWAIDLWNRIHADPTSVGYFDFRVGDVHCLTLDGRRYADPVEAPDTPEKSKLGPTQLAWLHRTMSGSDADLFVVFSADSFARRENPRHPELPGARLDCFFTGWPSEYRRVMTLFMDTQLRGKRVIVLSGDAHGLRVHYHPDPGRRRRAATLRVVEFICSGLRPREWSGPVPTDPTLDPQRHVIGHPGAGLIEIDPPRPGGRSITLRAVNARASDPVDAFPPLRLAFGPQSPPPPGD
jgi:PhoD-like phosphatase